MNGVKPFLFLMAMANKAACCFFNIYATHLVLHIFLFLGPLCTQRNVHVLQYTYKILSQLRYSNFSSPRKSCMGCTPGRKWVELNDVTEASQLESCVDCQVELHEFFFLFH